MGKHFKDRPRRRVASALAVAVVALLALVALVAWRTRSADAPGAASHRTADQSVRTTATSTPPPSPSLQVPVSPSATGEAAVDPIHLAVPRVGIDSALQKLGLLADGTLQPPTKWDVAGWYAGGVRPGDIGPAVIAGHVDSTRGPAVFFKLRQLRPGDQIVVTEKNGRALRFVVTEVRSYPKKEFPTAAVYGPTALPDLRLITCTGDFDHAAANYLSNLVVFAVIDRAGAG